MDDYRPGPRMKLFARMALPIGLFYLAFALVYHGWLLTTEGLGALQIINLIFAVPAALYLIWQGREWRRDPRFR